jgi:hypothetical protein
MKILTTAAEVRSASSGINVPLGAAALRLGSARLDDAKEGDRGQSGVLGAMPVVAARVGPEDSGERKHRAVHAHGERRSLAKRIGVRLLGAVVAVVLLWCDSALAAGPHVVLLRGWFGVFSTGLDSIAQQLRAQGIEVEVTGHFNWSTAVAEILRKRSAGQTGPLVLVGHSQGANNVIDMAHSLKPHKITVDLLVTLSPLMQNPIPANVVKAINYYPPGWGQPIAADRGFHGKIVNFDLANDLSITHLTITESARVQREIVYEITTLAQHTSEGRK